MPTRTTIVVVATLALVTLLYTFRSSPSFPLSTNSDSLQAPLGRYDMGGAPDVTVKLEQISASPPVVRAVLRNTDTKNPVTFLTWGTPFDELALKIGVLQLVDAETGDELQGPQLRLNRMMPPPRDVLVEIKPGGEVTKDLEIQGPWIPTDGNKKFKISASGRWMSVWKKTPDDVQDKDLEEAGGDNALTGYFKSEEVEITL